MRACSSIRAMRLRSSFHPLRFGELFFGAAKSGRASENTERIEEFPSGRAIIGCDLTVAREYGRVKWRLKAKGRPIPENDIWIAATALSHGPDTRHARLSFWGGSWVGHRRLAQGNRFPGIIGARILENIAFVRRTGRQPGRRI